MRKISEEILRHQRILVTTHVEPDGDAIGSALAMYHALRGAKKEAVVCLADSLPSYYRFLPGAQKIRDKIPAGFSPECVVILDCSDLSRTGDILRRVNPGVCTLVNIDHHDGNTRFGDFNLVERCAATGELVYVLAKDMGIPVSREMGMCIYTAILADTGGFRYRNTTRRSLLIAAEIVDLGVNPGEIAEKVFESYPMERFQVLGEALRNLQVSCGGKVADFFVSRNMLSGNGVSPSIVEGFVNYPREIEGVQVSVFFRERGDNQYRVSLRSKGKADVSLVAQVFGGGGHRNAAGCLVEGPFETVRERVLHQICENIRRSGI